MSATRVMRRRAPEREPRLEDRLLRFVDGLVVDPDRCPAAIYARSHWQFDPAGGPLAVCKCEVAP